MEKGCSGEHLSRRGHGLGTPIKNTVVIIGHLALASCGEVDMSFR